MGDAVSKRKFEERLSVEYLRLLSLFVEYLDKSTFITAFTFLGMVFVAVSPVLYVAGVMEFFPMVIITVYGGFTVILASLSYKRILRRRFNRYLRDVSLDTLVDNSEFSRYLGVVNEQLERQYEKLLDATDREKRAKELSEQVASLRMQNEKLKKIIESLESEKRETQ